MKNNKILKNEEVAIQKILMDHNPEDGLQGSPSLLNLTQALTAYGRNQNSARTREFAEIAGEMMDRVKQYFHTSIFTYSLRPPKKRGIRRLNSIPL